MKFSKSEIIVFGIVAASFVVGILFYPQMPERMASHWDAQGNVNGYMSRFWGLFFTPILTLGLALLLILLPRIDPLKENIKAFRKSYDGFLVVIFLFMLYLYLLTIVWNLGKTFNFTQLLTPAFGILIYYCGVLLEKAKRNWFIGIRTPWTLSSDRVWEKTHNLGGKLFKLAGIIAMLGVVFPGYAFLLLIAPVIAVAIFSLAYSFIEYQKEQRTART
ncbi:MAG: SdpI family protein [Dehalococcoidales bacterium]|nr:SdpI family protein [Dehalococcoidales bacterium]